MFLTHRGLSRTSSGKAANEAQLQITVITTGRAGVCPKSLIRSQMFIRQPAWPSQLSEALWPSVCQSSQRGACGQGILQPARKCVSQTQSLHSHGDTIMHCACIRGQAEGGGGGSRGNEEDLGDSRNEGSVGVHPAPKSSPPTFLDIFPTIISSPPCAFWTQRIKEAVGSYQLGRKGSIIKIIKQEPGNGLILGKTSRGTWHWLQRQQDLRRNIMGFDIDKPGLIPGAAAYYLGAFFMSLPI